MSCIAARVTQAHPHLAAAPPHANLHMVPTQAGDLRASVLGELRPVSNQQELQGTLQANSAQRSQQVSYPQQAQPQRQVQHFPVQQQNPQCQGSLAPPNQQRRAQIGKPLQRNDVCHQALFRQAQQSLNSQTAAQQVQHQPVLQQHPAPHPQVPLPKQPVLHQLWQQEHGVAPNSKGNPTNGSASCSAAGLQTEEDINCIRFAEHAASALEATTASEVQQAIQHAYVCPTRATGADDAKEHSLAEHTSAPQAAAVPEMEQVTRHVHLCPTCNKKFPTADDAKEHWLAEHSAAPQASTSPKEESTDAVATIQASLLASDEQGRPQIVRHIDASTGAGRTVVMNEDGSQRIFGENTITSMATRDEDELRQWLDCMSDLHMKGLAHEFGLRLVGWSSEYHSRREELAKRSEKSNYDFFSLTADACEKDLDNAYRRLARAMHPDKNGGTDEAKQRFQAMKKRYEALKERIVANGSSQLRAHEAGAAAPAEQDSKKSHAERGTEDVTPTGPEDDCAEKSSASPDTSGESAAKPSMERKEAYDEGGDDRTNIPEEDTWCLDPFSASRERLEKSVWQMLKQMKFIKHNLKKLDDEFEEFEAELAATSA